MKKTLTLAACLCVTQLLFAQTSADTARYIINKGLAVYAKDENSFTAAERQVMDSLIGSSATVSATANLLKSRSGQLKNVGGNVEEWLKLANANSGSGNYKALVRKIEETLQNPHSTDSKILTWRTVHVNTLFSEPITDYLNAAGNEETETAGTEERNTTATDPSGNTVSKPANENNMLVWAALATGILALIGVVAIWVLITRKISNYRSFKTKHRDDLSLIWIEIEKLRKGQPEQVAVSATPAGPDKIGELTAKIATLEKRLEENASAATPLKAPVPPPVVKEPFKKVPVEKSIPVTMLYAKLADLENGFSENSITDSQNGEQVFEIEAKEKTATFLVTNNVNAQKYALSDYRYYLEKACDFLNEPKPNCRIDTKETGALIKSGDHWIIQRKATIEFV